MPVNRETKEKALKELVDKFGRSKSVVFADYRGLNVLSLSNLRAKLRTENAELKVAKKTLMNLAAKDLVGELDKSIMEGPVFATFSYDDPLSGVRILFQFSKTNENVKLLGGIIEGKAVGPEIIKRYANLPSRPELLAKLLGTMMGPLSGFVGIGNSLIAGLVRVIDAYKDTLPAHAAPTTSSPVAEVMEAKAEAPVMEEVVAQEVTPIQEEAPMEEKGEEAAA